MTTTIADTRHLDAAQTSTSRGWFRKSAAFWLASCRGWDLSGGRLKFAELGGGQDVPFEQAFSNLAHAYVKDKAPQLLDYEVGFQLLEKNEENTKAIGVFGFKVGSQWLYAPVFFLNGDLKGHELLYIKSQDAFVPMKEAWINYLLGKKPTILGDGVGRNLSQLGVMPPNLYQLSRSPHKFASEAPRMQSWAKDFLPVLGYLTQTPIDDNHPKYAGMRGLEDFLKEAGAESVRDLLEACTYFPKIAQALDKFYGEDFLERMVKHAKMNCGGMTQSCAGDPSPPRKTVGMERSTKKLDFDSMFGGKVKKGGVKVVTTDQVYAQGADVIHDLSAKEKEQVVKERVVIKDTRDDKDVTIAFNVQTQLALQNPAETGLYEVLVGPDEFRKCLVLFHPFGERERQPFCTVVQLDGGHKWVNADPTRVWTRSTYDPAAFNKWWKELPSGESPGGSGLQILIMADGSGTCPFRVHEGEEGGEGDFKLYRVSYRDYARKSRPGWLPDYPRPDKRDYFDDDYWGPSTIRMTGKVGAKMRASNGELWVPDGVKKLSLKKAPENDGDGDAMEDGWNSDPGPLDLGNALELQVFLASHTTPMRIFANGEDTEVDGVRMDKTSALVHLVRDLGLREKQARLCLEQAAEKWARRREAAEFRLFKQAAPGDPIGDMVRGGPSAPPFPGPNVGVDDVMGSGLPTMRDSEHSVPVAGMSAANTNRTVYDPRLPDPKSMAVAQQAAQTGQKEVFDTSTMGSLLKSVRPDNMIDRYLGDMMKGMDRTGRVLFNSYWHGEEFEERYGKQDLPEIEDGLRNSFEGQGDIILKLKQKTVDPDVTEGLSIDLSQIAGA